jgi:CubicO group peptidase (beta-lactamase class C family)
MRRQSPQYGVCVNDLTHTDGVILKMFASTIAGLALFGMALAPAAVRANPVDNYIAAKMAEKSIPGLVLGVMRDGHVVKQKAYGYANLELKAPATLDTSFALASSTKIFTAAAIMQLVEQGKLTLDQPVSEIVAGLPTSWSKVTVRHCLSHTTGLAYEDYTQRFVLDPAGIKTARFGDAWAIIPGRADLYTNLDITADHKWLAVRDEEPVLLKTGILHYGQKSWPDYVQSQAGLNGSIRDLIKWEVALDSGKVIKAESLAEMERPYRIEGSKDSPFFGLGFVTYPIAGPGSISYGGGAAVWRVKVPSRHLIVIV